MIDTIIFDAEGVVIDSEPIWDQSQKEFLRRRGLHYDRARTKPLLAGRSIPEGAAILKQEYGLEGDVAALARERMEIVRSLFERELEFIPGFPDFFERIRGTFKTCLATVMPRRFLDVAVARLDLEKYFGTAIYDAESLSLQSKPAPDLFLYAARKLGSEPRSCVVIEDSPNGIEAARRAGMKSIGLATTFEPELLRADYVVLSYDDPIKAYLEKLRA